MIWFRILAAGPYNDAGANMTASDPMQHFADALALARDEAGVGRALHRLADALVGVKLFTCLLYTSRCV